MIKWKRTKMCTTSVNLHRAQVRRVVSQRKTLNACRSRRSVDCSSIACENITYSVVQQTGRPLQWSSCSANIWSRLFSTVFVCLLPYKFTCSSARPMSVKYKLRQSVSRSVVCCNQSPAIYPNWTIAYGCFECLNPDNYSLPVQKCKGCMQQICSNRAWTPTLTTGACLSCWRSRCWVR